MDINVASKYPILARVLDSIRNEATNTIWEKRYAVGSVDQEEIQQGRSRAYIHLYLKVMFGLADFLERESYITDGTQDGGIDAYFLDHISKRVYFIQSKFRVTEENFEIKKIDPEEILAMDIDRITAGFKEDAGGTSYNGKILGLERKISEIKDIARYSYEVVIIANCDISTDRLSRLTGGYRSTVFDFERSYSDLLFPIISGTYFNADDVTVTLDLSNKSTPARTSYSVDTPFYLCEVTVLFIPTSEIAKLIDTYRNSILEYNPRSYLDLDNQSVNDSIRDTAIRADSNAFALMNNGITIISDETNINERIGQHNKAQLRILRPQIINGGQTAYTLSRIFREDKAGGGNRLLGKEVLTKIITDTKGLCRSRSRRAHAAYRGDFGS